MTSKSKIKEDNELVQSGNKSLPKPKQPIIDFMPGWAKEEKQYRDAIVRDVVTKKLVEGGWPRPHNTSQWAYENSLSKVVDQKTGEFYPEKNGEGFPIKGMGARHVISVIT